MDVIAAGYGRTSKEQDDGFSLDSQFEAIRSLAASEPIILPSEYEFREEFSGRVLERPKLDALRTLVRSGKVQAVIVYATDRLSRKFGAADILLDEFFTHNVRLYIVMWGTYVKDTPEDRLRFNFEATFSDFERRKIAERMNRGKQDKLGQGIYLGDGNPPYGYRKVGTKKDMRLEIAEDEAAVIRKIYQWYAVDHISVAEITRRLRGIPTPAESKGVNFPHKLREFGEWASGTVYLILRNSTYSGTLSKWGATLSVPAIIDPALFEQARARRVTSRAQAFPTPRYEYLMSRRLRCVFCDYAIAPQPHSDSGVKTTLYYQCSSRRAQSVKSRCALPRFLVHLVDDSVWAWVRNLVLHPETITTLLQESQAERQEQTRELQSRLAHIEERLRLQEQRLGVVLREYAEVEARNDRTPAAVAIKEVYRQTKEQSEQMFNQLSEERESLHTALTRSVIENSLQSDLTTIAAEVREDIDTLPFAGRRELIEALNVRGELAFEEDKRVLYIIWHNHRFRRVLG